MKSDFKYWVKIATRFRDMDAMNHVNSSVYLTYFEIARIDYFDTIGLTDLKIPAVLGPAAVTQTCNYRNQVKHPATLDAGVRCARLGNSSFTLEYEFYLKDTDTLMFDGTTTMAWVDFKIGKSIPFPDVLREAINTLEGREV
ncbi:acyl-CoA thioesterase [bacterium AH-315-P07]|nr:acyl-CoA thioesterase [bacterium AH-315-P07]